MPKRPTRPYSARCIFIQPLRNICRLSCPSLNRSVRTAFHNYGGVWARHSPPRRGGEARQRRGGQFGETLRRSDHPVCASLRSAHPPLLCEEGNTSSFHSHALCQIAGLIDVTTTQHGYVI